MEAIWKKAVILGAIGMILGIFIGAGFWYLMSGEVPETSTSLSAHPNVANVGPLLETDSTLQRVKEQNTTTTFMAKSVCLFI